MFSATAQASGMYDYIKNAMIVVEAGTKGLEMEGANDLVANINKSVFEVYGKKTDEFELFNERYLSSGLTAEVKTIAGLLKALEDFDEEVSYESIMSNNKVRKHMSEIMGNVMGGFGIGGGVTFTKLVNGLAISLDNGDIYDNYNNHIKNLNDNDSSLGLLWDWGTVSLLGWKKSTVGHDYEYEKMVKQYAGTGRRTREKKAREFKSFLLDKYIDKGSKNKKARKYKSFIQGL